MRWIRLSLNLLKARFKSKINPEDTLSLDFRVWVTDVDVSIVNHASIMTFFEIGRHDYMVRSNFFKMALKKKWYFPTQAISVQYYRPLKMFQKARVVSRVSFIDEKWIYVEQKIIRNGKIIATCLVKNTVKDGRETVPAQVVSKEMKMVNPPNEKYTLISLHEEETNAMDKRLIEDWKV